MVVAMVPTSARPFGQRTGMALSTMACVILILFSAAYVGVCRRGGAGFCQPSGLEGQCARCPTTIPRSRRPQILGEESTFLPPDSINRGISNFGSGRSMRRLGEKLLAGQPITISFLGGSITWGRGGYEGGPFVTRFVRWLNASFPHPEHRIYNHGLPAVTSALFAACYDKVAEDSDLVVLDFAVNDGHLGPNARDHLGYSYSHGARRGFEQLVRKSLRLKGHPAVALLHFFSWNATRDKYEVPGYGGMPFGPSYFWRTIEDELSTAAQYYDVPVISLRNSVFHLLRQQRYGFRWNVSLHHVHGNAKLSAEQVEWEKNGQFFWDENHPWDRTGHRALAELLQAAVTRGVHAAQDAAWAKREKKRSATAAAAGPGAEAGAADSSQQQQQWEQWEEDDHEEWLPPPMVTDNYEANATSCHLQEDFKRVMGTSKGFKYEPRNPQEASFVAQKWGWTATQPGAQASIMLDTELNGLSKSLKQVQVHLLFLRSFKDMGRAKLACASGCKCEEQVLDGWWEREATLTDLHTFQASPHPKCKLQLTLLKETSSKSHNFSLSGAVVSSVDARMERGKIGQWEYHAGGGRR